MSLILHYGGRDIKSLVEKFGLTHKTNFERCEGFKDNKKKRFTDQVLRGGITLMGIDQTFNLPLSRLSFEKGANYMILVVAFRLPWPGGKEG